MEITYVVIVSIVTYVLGAITSLFIESIPNRYIPIQNVIIGLISAFICYFTGIEPNLLQSILLCLIAAEAAAGISDLSKTKWNGDDNMEDEIEELMDEEFIEAISDTEEVYNEKTILVN